jgi:uncharacterized protein (DUF2461 family)
MIKQTSLKFLTELKNNNSREWFEQNKILYQAYKDDIIQFTEKLLPHCRQSSAEGRRLVSISFYSL